MTASSEPQSPQKLRLRVLEGTPLGGIFPVLEQELTIGRSPMNTIRLTGTQISRVHATIRLDEDGSQWTIRDNASRNGIFINGLVAHAAGPNMSASRRRAFALLFMPEGATYNGHPAALPPGLVERLQIGDVLDDDQHLPLVWTQQMESSNG